MTARPEPEERGDTWGDVYARCRAKGMDASDAAFRADEWERRQKGKPETAVLRGVPMTSREFARHLQVVGSFIAFHDDRHMMGGYMAGEAFSALCLMLGFEPDGLRDALGARPAPDSDGGAE